MTQVLWFSFAVRVSLSLLLIAVAIFIFIRAVRLISQSKKGDAQNIAFKIGGLEADATGSSVLLLVTALPLVFLAQNMLPKIEYNASAGAIISGSQLQDALKLCKLDEKSRSLIDAATNSPVDVGGLTHSILRLEIAHSDCVSALTNGKYETITANAVGL